MATALRVVVVLAAAASTVNWAVTNGTVPVTDAKEVLGRMPAAFILSTPGVLVPTTGAVCSAEAAEPVTYASAVWSKVTLTSNEVMA